MQEKVMRPATWHVNGTNMAKGQLPKSSSKPGMWVTPKT